VRSDMGDQDYADYQEYEDPRQRREIEAWMYTMVSHKYHVS
jgi:hypothetical protein